MDGDTTDTGLSAAQRLRVYAAASPTEKVTLTVDRDMLKYMALGLEQSDLLVAACKTMEAIEMDRSVQAMLRRQATAAIIRILWQQLICAAVMIAVAVSSAV